MSDPASPLSDVAACRETQAYIDETIPKPDHLQASDQIDAQALHVARLVMHGRPYAGAEGDPLVDLAVARQILSMLGEASTAPIADRLDRAFAWAASPRVAIEVALFLGAQIIAVDPKTLTAAQVAALARVDQGTGYKAFQKRRTGSA